MVVKGDRWVDEEGRRLVLRGANLSGSAKVPLEPDGSTFLRERFYEGKGVSFVGRPLPLGEAEEHFERLARWGLRFHRLLVTWEAVEHDGPGVYDEAYLDYLEALVAKAGELGHSLFVDPHQDVWSRWTGGDGAPIWTLEGLGLRPEDFQATGAAILHQEMGEAYPPMVWFTNYNRLACATMWSLFFGAEAYAPGLRVEKGLPGEGEPYADFLQGRYIAAMAKVAARLGKFPNVVGFDSLNEPSAGFIGLRDLSRLERCFAKTGPMPTPWEAIQAGAGFPVEVDVYGIRGTRQRAVGKTALGEAGRRAWAEGRDCVWARAGVWGLEGGKPVLKAPGHFARAGGREADVAADFLKPFIARYARAVRGAAEGGRRLAVFVEGVPNAERPSWGPEDEGPVVDATHWYDDFTLGLKRWTGFLAYDSRAERLVFGPRRVRRYFNEALSELRSWSRRAMGGCPTLLGEFGLPFDLNKRRAYEGRRAGDYRLHEAALSAYYDAVDESLLDSTIWNYTPDNSHARGDQWNGEDLSVYCADEASPRNGTGGGAAAGGERRSETGDPRDSGGRALRGFVRPYALATAGEILKMRFSARKGEFLLRWRPDPAVAAPTLVYVPRLQYPGGLAVGAEGCQAALREDLARRSGAAPAFGFEILEARAEAGAAECVLRIRRA